MNLWRCLLVALAGCLVALAGAAAQTDGGKVHRLAVLATSDRSIELTQTVTVPALARLGFTRGRNLEVDYGIGPIERLPEIMARLLAARPDVILSVGGDAIKAARMSTSTVPIVMFGEDPVRLGLVQSLASPGGNLTGVSILASELDAKRLHLLHETVPGARRFGALLRPTFANTPPSESDMRKVAAESGLEFIPIYVAGPVDYADGFARMRATGIDALVIASDPEFFRDTAALVALARQARLPTTCQWREMAAAGCLLSYGPSLSGLRSRLADYIARILRGAQPRDMPIEQPSTFEFVVNLGVARTLGVTITPALFARADEVIE